MSDSTLTVVQRVRDRRAELNWTTERLAKETHGVATHAFLRSFETGRKKNLPLDKAAAIASALGMTVDELAGTVPISAETAYKRGYNAALKDVLDFASGSLITTAREALDAMAEVGAE